MLDGRTLSANDIARAAQAADISIDPSALDAMQRGHELGARLSEQRPVYGRTTGVGAARDHQAGTQGGHGLALLRSHAAGWGPVVPAPTVRAALAVRANQLLAGMSGANPVLARLLSSLAAGDERELPVVHRHGSLGTGDLTALAEVGLALVGDRPRSGGHARADLEITASDALPLLSSNAFAVAEAAVNAVALDRLGRAAGAVCAMSFVALQGNPEAFSEAAMGGTPFAGAAEAGGAVRSLVSPQPGVPAHIQDFFGLRTWPQVHGPLLDSVDHLVHVIEAMANTGAENPLFSGGDGGRVTHHGGFHAAYLALAADTALLALTRSAQAVQSRVSHMLTDGGSSAPLFLSGTAGASGLLIAEYVAASALSLIRGAAAAPSSIHTAHVSGGIEDDASFAGQAAARLGEAAEAYRQMLAVELVCAVRALRMREVRLTGALGALLAACAPLATGLEDRDLAPDFEVAGQIVMEYGARAPHAG